MALAHRQKQAVASKNHKVRLHSQLSSLGPLLQARGVRLDFRAPHELFPGDVVNKCLFIQAAHQPEVTVPEVQLSEPRSLLGSQERVIGVAQRSWVIPKATASPRRSHPSVDDGFPIVVETEFPLPLNSHPLYFRHFPRPQDHTPLGQICISLEGRSRKDGLSGQ